MQGGGAGGSDDGEPYVREGWGGPGDEELSVATPNGVVVGVTAHPVPCKTSTRCESACLRRLVSRARSLAKDAVPGFVVHTSKLAAR